MGDDGPVAPQIHKLDFHYIKSSSYREVSCHGAIGGTTPQGEIWMGLFAERHPIPRVVEFELLTSEGKNVVEFDEGASKPSRIESRTGIIRHLEFSAYMNIATAERIHKWLGDVLEKYRGERQE